MADHANESITIQAEPSLIMGVIADFPGYPKWAGAVKSTEVLDYDEFGRARQVRFDVEFLGLRDSYVNAYEWDDDHQVSWQLVEGKTQKSQQGSYLLEPSGDSKVTKVTYDLSVESAIPIPGLIRRRIQAKIVEMALKDLKKQCESLAPGSS